MSISLWYIYLFLSFSALLNIIQPRLPQQVMKFLEPLPVYIFIGLMWGAYYEFISLPDSGLTLKAMTSNSLIFMLFVAENLEYRPASSPKKLSRIFRAYLIIIPCYLLADVFMSLDSFYNALEAFLFTFPSIIITAWHVGNVWREKLT